MPPERLPMRYGRDRVLAIPRDPRRLYVFWELTAEGLGAAKDGMGSTAVGATLLLRVSDELGEAEDLPVGDLIGQRTLDGLRPGGAYVVALGWFAADCFAPVVISPPVSLPEASG